MSTKKGRFGAAIPNAMLDECHGSITHWREALSENSADVGAGRSNVRSFGVKMAVLSVTAVLFAAVGCGRAGPTDTREDVFGVGATPTLVVDGENGSVVINAATGNTSRYPRRWRPATRGANGAYGASLVRPSRLSGS